jgi:hypothetical protein
VRAEEQYGESDFHAHLELHLLEYHKKEWEYLEHYCMLADNRLDYVPLRPFSKPADKIGYDDAPISNEVITEVYMEFIKQTRKAESEAYMCTLPCDGYILGLKWWCCADVCFC